MTQPEHVPVVSADRVRPVQRLPLPSSWIQDRPGDLVDLAPPTGGRFGHNGPDLGYGLKLVKRFASSLQLAEGETAEDAEAGAFAVGCRRASLLGRAPVIYDFELAFTLFGYLGGGPEDLVAYRRKLFAGAAHHYWDQRGIVDVVTDDTLRRSPAQVRADLGQWRTMVNAG